MDSNHTPVHLLVGVLVTEHLPKLMLSLLLRGYKILLLAIILFIQSAKTNKNASSTPAKHLSLRKWLLSKLLTNKLSLKELVHKNIAELTTQQKADLVSNLMIVLCSDKETVPVVNVGN